MIPLSRHPCSGVHATLQGGEICPLEGRQRTGPQFSERLVIGVLTYFFSACLPKTAVAFSENSWNPSSLLAPVPSSYYLVYVVDVEDLIIHN